MLALEGIKILDLTKAAPGPHCTMILGDLGAEITKVEAPPGASRLQPRAAGEAVRRRVAFQANRRNSKSIGLNLKTEKARQIFYKLVETADVVAEEFRPGVAKRLGIGYDTLSKINPRIIYCSITSYGQNGPYRDAIAHDINSIAMAGALDLIGERGGWPAIPLNFLADLGGAGMSAAIGILAAIIARSKTGRGQHVDISMLDTVILLLAMHAVPYFCDNVPPKRGDRHGLEARPYYNIYETKDGKYITIGNIEPYIWEHFCREIGHEELIPIQEDTSKWKELRSSLEKIFITKTRDEWWELLWQKGVFVGKLNTMAETFVDPHVLHRQMVVELEHPKFGKVKQVGVGIKLSDTPGKVRSLPPMLGEQTEEILLGLGYSKESIKQLYEEKVVA